MKHVGCRAIFDRNMGRAAGGSIHAPVSLGRRAGDLGKRSGPIGASESSDFDPR